MARTVENFCPEQGAGYKSLDRAGVGTSSRVFHLQHQDLDNLVHFSVLADAYTHAAGLAWLRTGVIPTGGPFGAQRANLRSMQGAKKRTDSMHRIG